MEDESEVIRWIEEGRTYRWMVEEYLRKYNRVVSQSMFSNFRARRGLSRRYARDDNLIPWQVKPVKNHLWSYPLAMLRVESRRRSGMELRPLDEQRLTAWKEDLYERGRVVHYDPDTEQGWFYVPRRQGIDLDLIREPDRKTTPRKNSEK